MAHYARDFDEGRMRGWRGAGGRPEGPVPRRYDHGVRGREGASIPRPGQGWGYREHWGMPDRPPLGGGYHGARRYEQDYEDGRRGHGYYRDHGFTQWGSRGDPGDRQRRPGNGW